MHLPLAGAQSSNVKCYNTWSQNVALSKNQCWSVLVVILAQSERLNTYCASTVLVLGFSSLSSAIHGEHSVLKLSAFDFTVESLPLRLRDDELDGAAAWRWPCGALRITLAKHGAK